MRLWITTSPENFSAEYDDIEEMFNRGLSRLILDKRGRGGQAQATDGDYERWLMSLPMEFRDRIWVRGTPDLAEQLDVRGCVCNAKSLLGQVPECWKRINCVALCDTPSEALLLPDWVAGALVGPVMQPLSALEQVETFSVEQICDILKHEESSENIRPVPFIFWGGVDLDTLDEFKKLPAAGVAALGGIWNYADPVNAFIKLNRACGVL